MTLADATTVSSPKPLRAYSANVIPDPCDLRQVAEEIAELNGEERPEEHCDASEENQSLGRAEPSARCVVDWRIDSGWQLIVVGKSECAENDAEQSDEEDCARQEFPGLEQLLDCIAPRSEHRIR